MAEECDGPHDVLQRALGGEALAWLRDGVRRRLQLGRPPTGTVSLRDPSPEQAAAVGRLLGRPVRATKALQVRLEDVSDALARAGVADDVADAVQRLEGPIADRAAARAAESEAWDRAHAPLDSLARERPELGPWVASVRRTGLVRRQARDPKEAARLVTEALEVVDALPADGKRLARLAAETVGRAHALDDGQPLAALVRGAIKCLAGEPTLDGAEGWREAWAAVGVLADDLSSTVLALNLPTRGQGLSGRILTAAVDAGEPAALTLGQVVRHPPDFSDLTGRTVFVCENPTVMREAADRLGDRSHPLVCANGQPTVAVMRLLDLVARAGAQLRYHGDFDWPGLRIAGSVMRRVGAVPWRFRCADYLTAEKARAEPLKGDPTDTPWDPSLREAMERVGLRVEEEQVTDALLDDLARG